jgi:hypothetical protein
MLCSTYSISRHRNPVCKIGQKFNKISRVQTKFIGVQMTGIRILPGVLYTYSWMLRVNHSYLLP